MVHKARLKLRLSRLNILFSYCNHPLIERTWATPYSPCRAWGQVQCSVRCVSSSSYLSPSLPPFVGIKNAPRWNLCLPFLRVTFAIVCMANKWARLLTNEETLLHFKTDFTGKNHVWNLKSILFSLSFVQAWNLDEGVQKEVATPNRRSIIYSNGGGAADRAWSQSLHRASACSVYIFAESIQLITQTSFSMQSITIFGDKEGILGCKTQFLRHILSQKFRAPVTKKGQIPKRAMFRPLCCRVTAEHLLDPLHFVAVKKWKVLVIQLGSLQQGPLGILFVVVYIPWSTLQCVCLQKDSPL